MSDHSLPGISGTVQPSEPKLPASQESRRLSEGTHGLTSSCSPGYLLGKTLAILGGVISAILHLMSFAGSLAISMVVRVFSSVTRLPRQLLGEHLRFPAQITRSVVAISVACLVYFTFSESAGHLPSGHLAHWKPEHGTDGQSPVDVSDLAHRLGLLEHLWRNLASGDPGIAEQKTGSFEHAILDRCIDAESKGCTSRGADIRTTMVFAEAVKEMDTMRSMISQIKVGTLNLHTININDNLTAPRKNLLPPAQSSIRPGV